MNESEAKTKWCPFVRQMASMGSGLGAMFVASNRNFNEKNELEFKTGRTNCIGSSCMMWRWNIEANRHGPEIDHGYCGLAGKL